MEAAWGILVRAGVPCLDAGDVGALVPADSAAVIRATETVVGKVDELDERQRVSLLAWLSAWKAHFRPSFDRAFGERGALYIAQLRDTVDDANRYVKLRRIAREKLLATL